MKNNRKNKLRRGLSSLLALVMCVSTLQITAFAADDPWSGSVTTSGGETVEVEVTPSEPAEGENGTTTTWTGTGTAADGTTIQTEGSETVTDTNKTGSETITETKPEVEQAPVIDVDVTEDGDIKWDEWKPVEPSEGEDTVPPAEGGDDDAAPPTDGEDGDATPPTDSEDGNATPPTIDIPLKPESNITVDLEPGENGSFSGTGTAATLDWDAFKNNLANMSGLTADELKGLTQEDASKVEKDGTAVTVIKDGNKFQVQIVETVEGEVTLPDKDGFTAAEDAASTVVELTAADIPEGCEPVIEDGKIVGYTKSETVTNADGSKTTTTTTVTKTVTNGTGTATQTRTVKTTTIDLSDVKDGVEVEVKGELGKFEADEDQADPIINEYNKDVVNSDEKDTVHTSVSDDQLGALAKFGYWGNLNAVKEAGYDGTLTEADANAAMEAALLGSSSEGLSDSAKAFYDYLMSKVPATEPETPKDEASESEAPETPATEPVIEEVTTIGSATVNINEDQTTATVSFVVSLAPSITGDLLVDIVTGDGQPQTVRVQMDDSLNKGQVQKNEDGTYTVTIHNVQLNGTSVTLKLTTSETVTEREVYKVTTTVTGETVEHEDEKLGNSDAIDRVEGNIEFGNGSGKDNYNGVDVDYSKHPDGTELGNNSGITITMAADNKSATIQGLNDKDIEVKYIVAKAGNQYIVYEVPGGILHAGQTITVDSVAKDPTNLDGGIHGFSHLMLLGIGNTKDPETTAGSQKTSYGMTETTTTTSQSANLTLNLNLDKVTATVTEETQEQNRTGAAGMTQTQTNTTTQETIETVRDWNNTITPGDDDDDDTPVTPIIPGDDDDDDDDDDTPVTPVIPGDDDDDVFTPETIQDQDVPLANLPATVEPEAEPQAEEPAEEEDILDEDVPLSDAPEEEPEEEEPEEEEILDDDVPLANVPKTGDVSSVWYAALILSACGLLILKKRESEEA